MSKDWKNYPKQAKSLLKKGSGAFLYKTLGVDAELYAPNEDNPLDNPPLEMHAGFSRFVFTLIDTDSKKKVVINKANIPADDIPYVYMKTVIAMFSSLVRPLIKVVSSLSSSVGGLMDKILKRDSSSGEVSKNSPAYTQKLFVNQYKDKTAAEVLLENPSEIANLNKTCNWLKSNLDKYPNNKIQIDAIEDALRLQREGKLEAVEAKLDTSGMFEIYKEDIKYFSEKDDEGRNRIYGISIYYDPTKNYPFFININNCYAPLIKKPNGLINPSLSQAVNKTSSTMAMTEKEWFSTIKRVNKTLDHFEMLHSAKQFKISQKHSYKRD